VFSPEGRFLGVVDVPTGLTVTEIGADYVLGTMPDADGFARLRLWTLGIREGSTR
jgi:hypothetical protein